jgi:hypothetical protein
MNADRRKKITLIMWGSLALAVAATLWWRLGASDESAGEIKYRCLPTGPRDIECVFESDRDAPGVCMNLALKCDDGSHRTRVCSGPLTRGVNASVTVTDLAPPLPETPRCDAPTYTDVTAAD